MLTRDNLRNIGEMLDTVEADLRGLETKINGLRRWLEAEVGVPLGYHPDIQKRMSELQQGQVPRAAGKEPQ